MNLKINTALTAFFASATLLLANPAFAETAKDHSPNLGNTPMEGTETFQAFGGKEGLVKIMDDFMVAWSQTRVPNLFLITTNKHILKPCW